MRRASDLAHIRLLKNKVLVEDSGTFSIHQPGDPPSPLPSISVDSRPLLRVYYSQPPTPLSSPAMSVLSLCGSYPQSPEKVKVIYRVTVCQREA